MLIPEPDYLEDKPNIMQMHGLWESIKLIPVNQWSKEAQTLKLEIRKSHINGGISLYKYKISGNKYFTWYASRDRLKEIDFLPNILKHPALKDYRHNLELFDEGTVLKQYDYAFDIYNLAADLARSLSFGGAYTDKGAGEQEAWDIATAFVKAEFENRFRQVIMYYYAFDKRDVFYNILFSESYALFDKGKSELILIDVTDSD